MRFLKKSPIDVELSARSFDNSPKVPSVASVRVALVINEIDSYGESREEKIRPI